MTKARTLANFISDNNEFADGTISVSEVSGAAPLASPTFTGTTTVSGDFNVFNDNGASAIYDFKSDHYSQIQLTSDVDNSSLGGPYTVQIVANGNNGDLELRTNTVQYMGISQSGNVTFNEYSNDADFRVESDNNANTFFVNGGTGKIGIGEQGTSGNWSNGSWNGFGFNGGSTIGVFASTSYPAINLTENGYPNAASFVSGYVRSNTGKATNLQLDRGDINFRTAVSASAGSEITWYSTLNLYDDSLGAVFNENSYDRDFRVESDSNANAIFMDAGASAVGINTSSTSNGRLSVYSPTTYGKIFMSDSTLGYGYGAFIQGYGVTGSGGYFQLGSVDANTQTVAMQVNQQATSVSLLTRDGASGSSAARLTLDQIGGSGAVFNETGQNYDFRVESDSNTHALFVDAGNGRIGINQDVPGYTVDVVQGNNSNTNGIAVKPLNETQTMIYSFLGLRNTYYTTFTVDSDDTGSSNYNYFQFFSGTEDVNGELLILGDGGTIFNNGGHDRDFRVESDSNANAFKVDAGVNSGAGRVTIGTQNYELNGVQCLATNFGVPANTNRRMRVTVGNYESCKVLIMAQRTNGGDSFVWWEGFLRNNNNEERSTAISSQSSGGTISYTFTNNGDGTYDWDFNNSGSGGDGTITIIGARSQVSISETTY
jgi:hypothetical protein